MMKKNRLLYWLVAATMASCASAHGEKALMTKAELEKTATHIFVGKVTGIYSRTRLNGNWNVTDFVAEVMPSKIEKGKGIEKAIPTYVRYWHRSWVGEGHAPPSTSGHWWRPSEGDLVRVYAARNAYDGFTSNNRDGGLNVLGGDGFEILEKANDKTKRPYVDSKGKSNR